MAGAMVGFARWCCFRSHFRRLEGVRTFAGLVGGEVPVTAGRHTKARGCG